MTLLDILKEPFGDLSQVDILSLPSIAGTWAKENEKLIMRLN